MSSLPVTSMWLVYDRLLVIFMPRNLKLTKLFTLAPLMLIGAYTSACFLKSITSSITVPCTMYVRSDYVSSLKQNGAIY